MIWHDLDLDSQRRRKPPAESGEAGKSRARLLSLGRTQRADPLRIRLTTASRITAPPSETDSAPRLNWL